MLRKKLTLLLLLVAQVIILGHGLLPHHHQIDLISQQHHHHHDQDPNDHQNPLPLDFSGFIHIGEHIFFTNSGAAKTFVSKQVLQKTDALPFYSAFQGDYLVGFKIHLFPPDRYIIYQSPLTGANSLRGPPSFIVV